MEIYCYVISEKGNSKELASKFVRDILADKGYRDVTINRTELDRPYSKEVPFDFNYSHTKNMVAIVIGKEVGIDCEIIKPVRERVVNRVCTEDETERVNGSPNKDEEFIRLWTFKEAFTKMIGSGFKYGFKNATTENAFALYPEIKIFQRKIENCVITAVENNCTEINFFMVDKQ